MFQPDVFSGCQDLLMIPMINLSDTAILSGADYCSITNGISKNEAMNLLQKAYLTEKVENYNT